MTPSLCRRGSAECQRPTWQPLNEKKKSLWRHHFLQRQAAPHSVAFQGGFEISSNPGFKQWQLVPSCSNWPANLLISWHQANTYQQLFCCYCCQTVIFDHWLTMIKELVNWWGHQSENICACFVWQKRLKCTCENVTHMLASRRPMNVPQSDSSEPFASHEWLTCDSYDKSLEYCWLEMWTPNCAK